MQFSCFRPHTVFRFRLWLWFLAFSLMGAIAQEITAAETDYGSISGRVTLKADGSAVPNAEVRAYLVNESPLGFYSVRTDVNGYYQSGLRPGNYYVLATGYSSAGVFFEQEYYLNSPDESSATAVTVESGRDTSNIDFSLNRLGTISGRVTRESDGAGIYNISVHAEQIGWQGTST